MAFEGGISAMITKHVRAATPPALLPDEEAYKAQPELTEAQDAKLEAERSVRVRLIAVAQVGRLSDHTPAEFADAQQLKRCSCLQVLETGIAIHSVRSCA